MKLKKISTKPPKHATKDECKAGLAEFRNKLFELQNLFYADGRYGLLIILQGMDTSGKDGTIRHVMTCMNPMGLKVKSFIKPTAEELSHDFLWRIYPHIPAKGMIQVFNRSYYEDVVIPSVNKTITKEKLNHRINLINELENHLVENNINVIKLFLHISPETQKERIEDRIKKPDKRWKYSNEDNETSKKWDSYEEIYDLILEKCNNIPWQTIPADKRWYRNFAAAKILTEHLQSLDLKYPDFKII